MNVPEIVLLAILYLAIGADLARRVQRGEGWGWAVAIVFMWFPITVLGGLMHLWKSARP